MRNRESAQSGVVSLSRSAAGQRSPFRQMASSSAASSLHEVLANDEVQFLARVAGHELAVGDDGMREGRPAFAGALGGHGGDGGGDDFAGIFSVLVEIGDDIADG